MIYLFVKGTHLIPEDFHERWRLSAGRAYGKAPPKMGAFYPKAPRMSTVATKRRSDNLNVNQAQSRKSSSSASTGRLFSQFELYDFALHENTTTSQDN